MPSPQVESWRIASFVEEAGLAERAMLDIDFQPDGTVWIAASDGLYRSHGYVWQRFSTADGLPSDYVRCVRATSTGEIWIGTENGAGIFHERRGFEPRGTEENLAGPSVRRIVEAEDGTLWFCSDRWPDSTVRSGLTRLRRGRWDTFGVEEGLPSDYVFDVFVDSRGDTYVLTRGGLALMEGDTVRRPLEEAAVPGWSGEFWSMVELPSGELLAASRTAYFLFDGETWRRPEASPNGLHNPVLIGTRSGEVLGCQPGNPAWFLRWTEEGLRTASDPFPCVGRDVHDMAEAPDGSIWVVGLSMLVRWEREGGQWRTHTRIPPPALSDVEGGVWFADEDEVLRESAGEWTRFPGAHSPVIRLGRSVWMRQEGGLAQWSPEGLILHPDERTGLEAPVPAAVDGAGGTWVRSLDENGRTVLSRFDGVEWRQYPLPSLEETSLVHASGDTRAGIWLVTRDASERHRLVHLGDDGFEQFPLPPVARFILTPRIHSDRSGSLWLYGLFGLFRAPRSHPALWQREDGVTGGHVSAVVEWEDELWFAHHSTTGGTGGLSKLRSGEWTHFGTEIADVVGRGPDGAPSFVSSDGLVGIARSASGSRPTLQLTLPVTARIERAVADRSGGIWLSTGKRVFHFRPDGDPPDTVISNVPDDLTYGEELAIQVRGFERFQPSSRRAFFRVQANIDGQGWEELTVILGPETIVLPALEVGEHRMEIRVADEGGDVDPNPSVATFRVLPQPLQARSWFKPLVSALFLAILGLATFGLVARHKLRVQARGLEEAVSRRTAELHGSERKYRSLFEDSRDAILLVDLERRIEDGNPAAELLIGIVTSVLVGRRVEELFDDPEQIVAVLGGSSPAGFSAEHVSRGGGRQHVHLSANERRTEDGRIVGYQLIGRDVTERVQMEEKLRQTQKMDAVGRMAGGIAHDFNNILTAIVGYCDVIGQRIAGDEELEENLEVVLQQARRAKALIRQIQTFSRSGITKPRVVSLNEVVSGTKDLVQSLIRENVDLRQFLDPNVGRVKIDPGKLEQVIVNLAVNASDAMPTGGTLSIATSTAEDGKGFLLEVRDTGRGMDEETRRKMFEPFFSTKPEGQGSGLGLAIVYGIVDQAGGTIQTESALHRGTAFRIQLPRCDELPDPREERSEPDEVRHGRGAVLVVEDEPSIRGLIRISLQRVGYDVEVAQDGREAFEKVVRRSKPYDLVISDVVMPRMDGNSLLGRLKQIQPDLPFLFISGHPRFDVARPFGAGFGAPLLLKPFRPRTLLEKVHELVEK